MALDELQRLLEGQVYAFVPRTLDHNVTVPAGTTWTQHNLEIIDGVTLTIADGGELLML